MTAKPRNAILESLSRIAGLILILAVVLFGLLLHLQNDQEVTLGYYLGTIKLPLSVIIVLSLIAGAILGVLASLPLIFKLRRQRRRLEKQIKNSEKEINNLRVMPLKD